MSFAKEHKSNFIIKLKEQNNIIRMETQMTVYVDEIFNLLNLLLKNVIDFERDYHKVLKF